MLVCKASNQHVISSNLMNISVLFINNLGTLSCRHLRGLCSSYLFSTPNPTPMRMRRIVSDYVFLSFLIAETNLKLKLGSGILITVPIPKEHTASGGLIESAIQSALREARLELFGFKFYINGNGSFGTRIEPALLKLHSCLQKWTNSLEEPHWHLVSFLLLLTPDFQIWEVLFCGHELDIGNLALQSTFIILLLSWFCEVDLNSSLDIALVKTMLLLVIRLQ